MRKFELSLDCLQLQMRLQQARQTWKTQTGVFLLGTEALKIITMIQYMANRLFLVIHSLFLGKLHLLVLT